MRFCLGYLLLLLLPVKIYAQHPEPQDDSTGKIGLKLDAMAIGTANKQVPFWMRTNQYGSIPLDGPSVSLVAAAYKDYAFGKDHPGAIEWGGGLEGRLNAGRQVNFLLIEAYLKARWQIFQVKAGRSRDIMGVADNELSSGNFSVSGNALGIPKIELSIPEYWTVPYTKEMLSIKGTFSYGWLGTERTNPNITDHRTVQTLYHQKSFYARFGKPGWKVKLYGGFNHQVIWGGERKMYGNAYGLSNLESALYATLGKAYGNDLIQRSKIGNHLGSLDQAIEYSFNSLTVKAYHEFFYDVGGLYHLSNIRDGLWGIAFTNTKESDVRVRWNRIVLEFMYSKDQGGGKGSKVTPSGDEDYYNNYLYPSGWTYEEENLGNNFITNKKYQRKELPQQPHQYIGNNRVALFHAGVDLSCFAWNIIGKLSYSMNYGTYATSPDGISTGRIREFFPPPYFSKVNQLSGYLEASRSLKKNYTIGFVLAADYGDLLYNSIGGMIKLSKKW